MASDEIAIRLRGLRKVYRLYRKPSYRALDILGLLPAKSRYFSEHAALKDVDLDVRRGEKVAIIGRNGAGKSTLLRLITGVTPPTAGTLEIHGETQALLSIGTGFHPELTGRQNVEAYLANFGIIGRPAQEMLGEIIDFAELEEYIDQPTKTYSSGMGMRLMFAASTVFVPDLLVIDEVLSVGDAYFQAKSFERIREICTARGTTLLLVTHDIYTASTLCERMIWIDQGTIVVDADSPTVLKAYDTSIRQQEEARLRKKAMLNLKRLDARQDNVPLLIELRSPTNMPAASPIAVSRFALMDGSKQIAAVPLTGNEQHGELTAGLVADSGVWGDVTTWNQRSARLISNYGSSFHKVGVSFLLPRSLATRLGELSVEVEAGADEAYTLEAWRIDDDLGARSLGVLPSKPGEWSMFRASLGGVVALETTASQRAAELIRSVEQHGSGRLTVSSIHLRDAEGRESLQFMHGTPVTLVLEYEINDPTLKEHCQIAVVFRRNGVDDVFRLFGRTLLFDGRRQPRGKILIRMERLPLGVGEYSITPLIAGENYYDENPSIFYSINPKVYWSSRNMVTIKVDADHLIPKGTCVVGEAIWSIEPESNRKQE